MADMNQPASGTPDTVSIGQAPDLASYRQARSEGKSEIPNPAKPAAPGDDPTPDPEVEADPELRSEIDTLEKPSDDETPQQKAARTRKHKADAQRRRADRWRRERGEQRDRADRLERELNELRSRQLAAADPVAASGQPTTTPPASGDPEPEYEAWAQVNPFEDYAAKHPNHPDPYGGYQREYEKAHRAWQQRQADAAASVKRQQDAVEQSETQWRGRWNYSANQFAEKTPDFDAVIESFMGTHQKQAYAPVLDFAVRHAPDPAAFAYHLGKHPEVVTRLIEAGRNGTRAQAERAVLQEVGAIRSEMAAAMKAAAPPQIETPPPPHTPGGAGGATASFDPTKSDSLEDWRKNRERVLAR